MKAIALISLISYCVMAHAQAPQTSQEKFAEFIPLYPKGKMTNSKGMNLKDSIANERIYRVGTPGMYAFFPVKSIVICNTIVYFIFVPALHKKPMSSSVSKF